MKHRNDIDGLRAVAVLPVIAFHYGMFHVAPGGFVGVDVFFVISGYLITGILNRQMNAGTYHILDFYERRVRRIFPALFAMFAFCAVCAMALNFPSEVADIGRSIAASIVFVSNVVFYRSSGYFDQKMELNPVLHTWSLSVEEQFYVFFPLLLLAMQRLLPSARAWVFGAVALASFFYSAWMVQANPSAAFYLVQSRAWELLIGSLLAVGAIPEVKRKVFADAIGLAGMAMICASVALMSAQTPFPGAAALLPCLGAAAVLHSGAHCHTTVRRLLSTLPMRFVGQISYSLYLWHWPLLVFYRLDRTPNLGSKLGLIAACFVMSILSWHFVERPFRVPGAGHRPRRTMFISAGVMATGLMAALLIGPLSARLWTPPDSVQRTLAYVDYDGNPAMRTGTCFLTSGFNEFNLFNKDICLAIAPNKKNYLLVGDSHAAHLWAGLSANYPNINFLQATASGCKPVVGTTGAKRCTDLIQFLYQDFLPHHLIDGVILSARWNVADLAGLQATRNLLRPQAKSIVVFGPIVEYDQALPRILARGAGMDEAIYAASHRLPEQAQTDRLMMQALRRDGVKYFSPYLTLCAPTCRVRVDGDVPLQFDYGHLTREGSVFLMSRLGEDFFDKPVSLPPPAAVELHR